MSDFDRKLPPLTVSAALRWDALSQLLPSQLGDVLEIGCGQGGIAARMASRATSVLAIEPDQQSFAVAKQRLEGVADVRNIASDNLPSDLQFDTICAFEVLEHIEHDAAALNSWIARLRPGGRLVLSVPAHSDRMGLCDELVGHFRRYDRQDVEHLFRGDDLQSLETYLYGGPGGFALEQAREMIARRELKARKNLEIAERTASSGRFLQPANRWQSLVVRLASMPALALQRIFPDRGPGLIAIARYV